ncbi:MAG TPA: helix-hairpin-helix domain-containing protein, partial [Saprospiraceae bacterium]|nr:helix-hairpin-helix domain-containing protein [Saprospiraceae bacterium]
MKKRLLRILAPALVLAIGLCSPLPAAAQSDSSAMQRAAAAKRLARDLGAATSDRAIEELLENFFRDNDGASESDAQMFLENLEAYRSHPLDLNRASAQDLQELRLLSELQIRRFVDYRERFGPFLNAYELQAIPDWELDDIRMLLLFGRVQTGLEQRQTRLIRGFAEGQNQMLLRAGRFEPATYTVFGTDSELGKANVEGGPYTFGVRYRHSFDNRLRFGFTAENDAGEAFAQKSNPQGFDFYSAHLFVQQMSRTVQAVALGDYTARFGQGLLLQMGFAANKSAESVSVLRGGRKLNAYAAFGEVRFFRGAATTLAFGKHWEMTALYSNRRRDANVDSLDTDSDEVAFTSLQIS